MTQNADLVAPVQVGWWDNDEPEYARPIWHFEPLDSQGPHDVPVFILSSIASSGS